MNAERKPDQEFMIAYAQERRAEGATLHELVRELQQLHDTWVAPGACVFTIKMADERNGKTVS